MFINSKKATLTLIITAFCALTLSSCSKKAPQQLKAPEVVVTKVKTEDLSKVTSVVGQIVTMEQVNLNARVSGFLTKRNFEPGQFVKKGQLLYQIQQDQYKAKLEASQARVIEAQADYDFAKIEFNRLSLLIKQNATSQEKVDEATGNLYRQEGILKAAKADLELATLNLSYTDIYSPFDGRIGMYQYSVGNMVGKESQPLAVVTQVDPIWISFNYSEALFQTLLNDFPGVLPDKNSNSFQNVGDKVLVKLILSNGAEYNLNGRIDFIDNVINPLTGTIQIKAIFPNPQEKLIAGGYVQVQLSPDKKNPCMLIPQSSLQEDQTGPYVFVVNDKQIVEQRYVQIGTGVGENVIIASGLTAADTIISQGVLRVRPGIKVNAIMQKDKSTTSTVSAAADTQKAATK